MPVSGVNPMAAQQLQMQAQQAAQQRMMMPQIGQGQQPPGGPPGLLNRPGNLPPGLADRPGGPPGLSGPSPEKGPFDPRGLEGIAARGANVYMGGLPSAPGAGRPRNPTPTFQDTGSPGMQGALQRRMQQYSVENQQHQAATKRRGG